MVERYHRGSRDHVRGAGTLRRRARVRGQRQRGPRRRRARAPCAPPPGDDLPRRPRRPASTTGPCSRWSARTRPAPSPPKPSPASTCATTTACTPGSGSVDVVPFVAARRARPRPTRSPLATRFGAWAAADARRARLRLRPRTLAARGPPPGVRRPRTRPGGRPEPHPTAGRLLRRAPGPLLVAYNVWLADADLDARPAGGRRGAPARTCARSACPWATGCRCR